MRIVQNLGREEHSYSEHKLTQIYANREQNTAINHKTTSTKRSNDRGSSQKICKERSFIQQYNTDNAPQSPSFFRGRNYIICVCRCGLFAWGYFNSCMREGIILLYSAFDIVCMACLLGGDWYFKNTYSCIIKDTRCDNKP